VVDALRTRLPRQAHTALALLALLLVLDAGVILLHVVNELAGVYAQMFNLDQEQNLPTWLSSAQFLCVAVCAVLAGVLARGRVRTAWWALAAIFVFFSVDEVALVHEKLAEHFPSGLDVPKLPVIYSPVFVAVVLALAVVVPEVRLRLGAVSLVAAGFALLAGSLVLDAADVQALDVPRFRPLIIAEEGFELAGTALLATAFLSVFLVGLSDRSPSRRP